MNYYPHHIGDFNNATRHLNRLERGLYRDMLDMYYDTEQPLLRDVKELCRKLLARTDEEVTAVQQVLNDFFTESEQGWFHARCDAEIQKFHKNIHDKSEAGKASAAAKAAAKLLETQNNQHDSTGVKQPRNKRSTNQNHNHNHNQLKKDFDVFATPDWIPSDAWAMFVESRKESRSPLTANSMKIAIKRLNDLRADGYEPRAVLEHCVLGGYKGIFAPGGKPQRPADMVVR